MFNPGHLTPHLNTDGRFLRGGLEEEMLNMEEDAIAEHNHAVQEKEHSHGYQDRFTNHEDVKLTSGQLTNKDGEKVHN